MCFHASDVGSLPGRGPLSGRVGRRQPGLPPVPPPPPPPPRRRGGAAVHNGSLQAIIVASRQKLINVTSLNVGSIFVKCCQDIHDALMWKFQVNSVELSS